MSHTSRYKMKCKDFTVLKSVLEMKGVEYRENCTVSLYGSSKVEAKIAFKLPGWRYECAVTEEGEIMFDHFGSKSDTFDKLGETVQAYNKEAIMNKAIGFAQNWWEETTKDSVKLVLEY